MPMEPELKKKWVDALRSGEYKQGRTYLRRRKDNTFCCLGVLCEVAGISKSLRTPDVDGYAYQLTDTYSDTTSIPDDFLGVPRRERNVLISMNDGIGGPCKSFEEIANYIEKTL